MGKAGKLLAQLLAAQLMRTAKITGGAAELWIFWLAQSHVH